MQLPWWLQVPGRRRMLLIIFVLLIPTDKFATQCVDSSASFRSKIQMTAVDGNNVTHQWKFCMPNCPAMDLLLACAEDAPMPPLLPINGSFVDYGFVDYDTSWNILEEYGVCMLNGSYISYTCPEGYIFNTTNVTVHEVHCIDSDWVTDSDMSLPCTPVNCTEPPVDPPVNVISLWDKESQTYGTQVTYTCKESSGWVFPQSVQSSISVWCQHDKTWSKTNIEECKELPCKEEPEPLRHASITKKFDTVEYECEKGYEYSDNSSIQIIKCVEHNWEIPDGKLNECKPRKCEGKLPAKKLKMMITWNDSHDYKTKVIYKCPKRHLTWGLNQTEQEGGRVKAHTHPPKDPTTLSPILTPWGWRVTYYPLQHCAESDAAQQGSISTFQHHHMSHTPPFAPTRLTKATGAGVGKKSP